MLNDTYICRECRSGFFWELTGGEPPTECPKCGGALEIPPPIPAEGLSLERMNRLRKYMKKFARSHIVAHDLSEYYRHAYIKERGGTGENVVTPRQQLAESEARAGRRTEEGP